MACFCEGAISRHWIVLQAFAGLDFGIFPVYLSRVPKGRDYPETGLF